MTIRNRNELKSLFRNETRLSEQHFADLIDSTLNKRGDKFLGIWKPKQVYCPGDIVIHGGALWIAKDDGNTCFCSNAEEPPSEDSDNWEAPMFLGDGDWEVLADKGVMWAKVYEKVGIGIGGKEGECPRARLDVYKSGQGRWLLFPENNDRTQFSLLHFDCAGEQSYLATGLSLDAVNWLSDASKGFVFRKGCPISSENAAHQLDPGKGQVLVAIKPQSISDRELATLGLNVENPAAMLDVIDSSRGQLLFSPHEKIDPALSIVNLNPECGNNYIAIGIGKDEGTLVSDAPAGFVFRQGGEYGQYCHEKEIGQGNLLVSIRQQHDDLQPQLGIGTGNPQANLDIQAKNARVQILPNNPPTSVTSDGGSENHTVPVISLHKLFPEKQQSYLTAGLAESVAGWITNAEQGFVFRQGESVDPEASHQQIDRGQTSLAIREDGRIGIGTETPFTRLEITNSAGDGKFLFNLDRIDNPAIGILNLEPTDKQSYFTIGADNKHAVLVSDSQYGFVFKAGEKLGSRENSYSEIDINQGEILVCIRPEGKGRMGIGKQPLDDVLEVNGMARAFTFYQDTDRTKVDDPKPLAEVLDAPALEKLQQLKPVVFKWKPDTGFQEEGDQIGFLADQVQEVFSQVVRTANDTTQAVAYQNLVPVLVQALQDLNQEKELIQQELQELRTEFTDYQEQIEARMQQLEDRLEQGEQQV